MALRILDGAPDAVFGRRESPVFPAVEKKTHMTAILGHDRTDREAGPDQVLPAACIEWSGRGVEMAHADVAGLLERAPVLTSAPRRRKP